MNAATVLTALSSAGCRLLATSDGRIDIEIPADADVDDLLAQLRDVKLEALAILRGSVCIDCGSAVPDDLCNACCDACFQARKLVPLKEVARRREDRRQHTIERLRNLPCSCGSSRWHVNAEDSWCLDCFEAGRITLTPAGRDLAKRLRTTP